MIRLTYLLRRLPSTSRAEFQRYWREVHGPLVAGFASSLHLLRYVQVHTILDEAENERLPGARGSMETPYDGVEEMWWAGREEMVSGQLSSEGQRASVAIVEDERAFIDLPNSPLWFNYEYPQINPAPETIVATEYSSLIKSYFAIRQLPRLAPEEAQLYWRTCHGFVLRRIAAAGHIRRYVQVHRYEDAVELSMRKARGTQVEPYIGHAELWLDRNCPTAPEIERGWQIALEDERRFIDFARSSMWYCKEHVLVDNR